MKPFLQKDNQLLYEPNLKYEFKFEHSPYKSATPLVQFYDYWLLIAQYVKG